ncbi:glycosyltransferase [Fodinibius sp. AD559]|uniref:glycosyltransferase n=1 Tax=Fodinibius sp. AD559 TaxID=3424179 RepID=UPI0040469C31
MLDSFSFFNIIEQFIIGYFLTINTVYLALVVGALIYVRKQMLHPSVVKADALFKTELFKSISILVPAYNEADNIVESVESLLKLEYPEYHIIVVNDGSTDDTLQRLIEHFNLTETDIYFEEQIEHEQIRTIYRSPDTAMLTVIDKKNGGKADALNAGINIADTDLVCSIDADSILEQNVLKKLIQTFIEHKNTIAAGGVVRVINGCEIENREIDKIHVPKNFWARLQSAEYIRAFLFGRVGWDYFKSLLIVSGAFGIFDRQAVIKVGGYLTNTVGEDIELIVRLHSYHLRNNEDYQIRFLPEPICWTEVPTDYKSLRNQRNRWHRGLADSLWRHKYMLFNPSYKHIGMFVMPFFLIFELLGPIVNILSYIYLIVVISLPTYFNLTFILLFLAVSIIYGMVLSLIAILAEEIVFKTYDDFKDIAILSLFSFLENLGYRQIHAWWQFKGLIDFFKGKKSWGKMVRKGFKE